MSLGAQGGDRQRGRAGFPVRSMGEDRGLRSRVLFLGMAAIAYAGLLLLAWWAIEPTYLPIFAALFLGASICAVVAGGMLIVAWAITGPLTRGRDDERGPQLASSIVKVSLYVLAAVALGFVLGAVLPWLVQGEWIPGGDLLRVAIHAVCYWIALLAGGALFCGLLLQVRDRIKAA